MALTKRQKRKAIWKMWRAYNLYLMRRDVEAYAVLFKVMREVIKEDPDGEGNWKERNKQAAEKARSKG